MKRNYIFEGRRRRAPLDPLVYFRRKYNEEHPDKTYACDQINLSRKTVSVCNQLKRNIGLIGKFIYRIVKFSSLSLSVV